MTPVLEQVGAQVVVLPAAELAGQARVAEAPQVVVVVVVVVLPAAVARFQWARSSTAAGLRERRLNSPRQHRRSR
ncbi:MAG: hypothetical protein ACSLE7_08775 [Mycobacterium sp.]